MRFGASRLAALAHSHRSPHRTPRRAAPRALARSSAPSLSPRSLKPENVLLSGRADAPHVRLADFGLATVKSGAERASRISAIAAADEKRGTWPYMAPEMYRSRAAPPAAASRSTDVFAFGTLMHEVLSARVPWRDFSELDRLAALREGGGLDAALLPRETPAAVLALLARCLALDRARRPRAAELLAALEQAHENVASGHCDVFLSYAWGARGARKPLASELYLALRAAGLRVWLDEAEMGHDLAASMSEGIAKSEAVVVLASPDYAASPNCMFELRAAAAAGKPIVACCAEPGFWRTWGLRAGTAAAGAAQRPAGAGAGAGTDADSPAALS